MNDKVGWKLGCMYVCMCNQYNALTALPIQQSYSGFVCPTSQQTAELSTPTNIHRYCTRYISNNIHFTSIHLQNKPWKQKVIYTHVVQYTIHDAALQGLHVQ